MLRLMLRPLLMLVLAAYFGGGLGYAAVASNTAAIEMARHVAMAGMTGMECDRGKPARGCEDGIARCVAGCVGPSAALSAAPSFSPGDAGPARVVAPVFRLSAGMASPPGLPPPRTTDIG